MPAGVSGVVYPRSLAASTRRSHMKLLALLSFGLLIGTVASAQQADCLRLVRGYASNPPLLPGDTLRLSGQGGSLLYVGVPAHTSDPADPFFERLDELAAGFQPTVVFYEGPDRGTRPTRDETIRELGESGYARFLAAQMGAQVARLEPAPQHEFAAVADTLGAERAALFFLLRETSRLRDRRGLAGDSLHGAVADLIRRAAPLGLPVASTDELGALFHAHVDPDLAWTDVPGAWFDPLQFGAEAHFFPTANRASSHFRNVHMAQTLAASVGNGARVMAVVGRNHLPMQAEALRCLLAP